MYDSGVTVAIEPRPYDPPDDSSYWQRIADQDNEHGVPDSSVTEVRGHPAFAVDALLDPIGGAAGGAEFFEGGDLISVAGNGKLALSDLLSVAETLAPAGPTPSPS